METKQFNALKEFELSEDDGKTWTKVRLPFNSLPYHQCMLLGHFEENGNMYRTSSERR
jgi:hypothetical protein